MNKHENEVETYKRLIKVLAAHFGPNTEIVLHDFSEGFDSTIVAIENNHVTGRNIGGCATNLGMDIINNTGKIDDILGGISKLPNGKTLRTSSFYLYDKKGKLWGSICINTDISAWLQLGPEFSYITSGVEANQTTERFVHNVNELLDFYISEYESLHPTRSNKLSKEEKFDAVRFFESKGAFMISKAGPEICKYLHISKGTLYSYLDSIRQNNSISLDDNTSIM